MSSPFSDFANATLVFPVSTGATAIDPATGNRPPIFGAISVSAMLKQGKLKGDSDLEEFAGSDRVGLMLSGRAVAPLRLPNIIPLYAKASASFQGQAGEFTLQSIRRSPYGSDEILGDRIAGLFRPGAVVPSPSDPYVPPTPSPTTGGSYETIFTQADLSIAGLLPVTHGLSTYPSSIALWDGTGELITPDDVQHLSLNTLAIDLTSFAPLQGAWTLSIGT